MRPLPGEGDGDAEVARRGGLPQPQEVVGHDAEPVQLVPDGHLPVLEPARAELFVNFFNQNNISMRIYLSIYLRMGTSPCWNLPLEPCGLSSLERVGVCIRIRLSMCLRIHPPIYISSLCID